MNKKITLLLSFICAASPLFFSATSNAASLGKNPAAGLVQGPDGSLYGTTANGGINNFGTVFKIGPDSVVTELVDFAGTAGSNRGAAPLAPLVFGKDGKLYGTTSEGGANNLGTVFRVSVTGVTEILHDFAGGFKDGAHPRAKLMQAVDGNFYGATYGGGASSRGTIFRLNSDGSTTIFSFDGTRGAFPSGGLVQARDGFFYGVASAGGAKGLGTIFRADPIGNITLIHSFTDKSDGSNPQGELVEDPSAARLFYGTTSTGGANGFGTCYKVNANGLPAFLTVMAPFDGVAHGANPHAGFVLAGDGALYGTTFAGGGNNLGTVFKLNPSTNTLTRLASFMGTDGAGPNATLIESATAGTFFGTAYSGGSATSGAVLKITPSRELHMVRDFALGNSIRRTFGSMPNAPSASLPVITSATSVTVNPSTFFTYQITASNTPTSFNAAGLPGGLSVDPLTGLISGSVSPGGNYTVTISATNDAGTGMAALQLIVIPAAPSIISATNATGQVAVLFSYQIVADHSPTSFSATGLPFNLSVDTTTGVISGTPGIPGTFDVVVTATNSLGPGTAVLHLTILQTPPAITSLPSATAQRSPVPFTYHITANNNPTSYDAFILPAGLSVDHMTGVISGAPQVEGTYNFTIAASNAAGTGSAPFRLTVVPPAPIINSPSTTTGIVGSPFAYQIKTVEPIITPIDPLTGFPDFGRAYAAFGVPPGLNLDPVSGIVSGTPTTSGTYQVVVEAGSTGGIAAATVTFTISGAAITSPLVATGTVGQVFAYQITSSYNAAQTFTASNLPAGVILDVNTGVISGIPTVAGVYSVPISARPTQTLPSLPPVSAVLQITISPAGGGPIGGVAPAKPAISPGGGTFKKKVSLTMTEATAGATIRYTIDGSTPTSSSAAYHGQIITISGKGTKTIKAIAFLNGQNSTLASATFTIK